MSYSNSVATWVSGSTVPASEKRGWKTHIWAAVNTTTAEPDIDSSDWALDDPLKLSGVTLLNVHDTKDFLKTGISGITLMQTHVSRPPAVQLCCLTLMQYRPSPAIV